MPTRATTTKKETSGKESKSKPATKTIAKSPAKPADKPAEKTSSKTHVVSSTVTKSAPSKGKSAEHAPAKTVKKTTATVEGLEIKPTPETPKESLSLIDEKVKKPRVKATADEAAKRKRSVLPPISRILAPKSSANDEAPKDEPPTPEPVTASAEQTTAISDADAETESSSDDRVIHIKPPIIVKDLAQMMDIKPFQLIHDLMEMNIFANINQTIEPDVAAQVCEKHGFIFEKDRRQKGEGVHKVVETVAEPPPPPPIEEQKKEEVQNCAPIVTFMGHVDHGKTSLMDAIRNTRVTSGEAGGITQHIGAYSVTYNNHRITFLDTPGHAAFTAMRARGANVTNIVVLVVAADDGLMPQTIEAINHAKAANVQLIVAINKIDLASANIDRVKGQLQEKGLVPEDWGGDIICCPVSATKRTGINELLDMILLQAEIMELKANPHVDARATVIEAQIEPGRGPTATLIVRMGTLKTGDPFICGHYSGKVKLLVDDLGRSIKEAGPATPVKIIGFAGLPNAGDELVVMESERATKILSEERLAELRKEKLTMPQRARLENLFASFEADQKKTLKVVLKADVQGSLEALIASLGQIESKKIDLEIIHSAVGPITDSDVLLASASNAIVVGFNVKVENSASNIAKREAVQIKLYSIIYELIDQIKEAMTGMLDPENREAVIGHAEVKKVFDLSRGVVAGSRVTDGRLVRNARARLLRGKQPIYDGGFATLKHFTEDVKEVRSGQECGVKLGDFTEYEVGDIIECYVLEKVAQKL